MTPSWKASARWSNLRIRAEILRRTRAFFDVRDFIEVETPQLSSEAVVEAHIDPVSVMLRDDPRTSGEKTGRFMWLQASPEAGMKRLLASAPDDADAPRGIYQIGRAFRAAETGDQHNVEFTLAEWYCTDHDMDAGMQLLADLCGTLLGGAPAPAGGVPAAAGEAERVSYREAFLRHAEIDPHTADVQQLAALATASGVAAPANLGDDRDAWLDLLLTDLVVPRFSTERPTILYDYPTSQAALARVGVVEDREADSPPVAKRFELFVGGLELANGYWELLDADVLRTRTDEANSARAADDRDALPVPEKLLAAMDAGLPACTGCALGIDRVVMLATGAKSIAEVIALPTDRA